MRAQAVPTEAQRAAFERALARRNAERAGGGDSASDTPRRRRKKDSAPTASSAATPAANSVFTGARPGDSKSLTDLARMATNKRPLASPLLGTTVPKRAMFAVGSGVAAVILVGVLGFELIRPDHSAVAQQRGTQVASSQIFAPGSGGQDRAGTTQLVPSSQPGVPAPGTFSPPVPQNFDPNIAPSDPPPPPALERPGPMEPPGYSPDGSIQPPPYAGPPGTPAPAPDPDAPPIFQ